MDTALNQDISITLPRADMALLKAMAKRMGWVIAKPAYTCELDEALEDIAEGRVTTHPSVDAYFKAILD